MNLKPIAFIITILGISILLVLSQTLQPKLSKIYELQNKQTFDIVRIQGALISQKLINNSSTMLLQIKDQSGKIDVIVNQKITIPNNSTLEIIGKITEYKSETQITADKIKVLK